MKCGVNFRQMSNSRKLFFYCFSYETRCYVRCFVGATTTTVSFENSSNFVQTFLQKYMSSLTPVYTRYSARQSYIIFNNAAST